MTQSKKIVSATNPEIRRDNSDFPKMFVHHVFFWLKEPDNKVHLVKFKKELEQLVSVETIRYNHIGIPADTDREVIDNSYQFSLLVIFENRKGHDIYQDHEKHLQFIRNCEVLWEKVLVYDSCL